MTFVFYSGIVNHEMLEKVTCDWCGNIFLKDKSHVNENIKLRHKIYCSIKCQSKQKNKQLEFICENPTCTKTFKRRLKDISPHNYCSRSCAAKITNSQRIRIIKPKIIKPCRFLHNKETVVQRIKKFVFDHKRIPVKREMWSLYEPARRFFGTWNNAIKAAGFEPNPIMFANKQEANDGHICDSLAEKVIDDYLFEKGINHERNLPYPKGEYTADFKIGDQYIEYFGLAGEHIRYDELMVIKKEIAIKYQMNLLEIYPKNLYAKNGLDKIFNEHLYFGQKHSTTSQQLNLPDSEK